MTMACTRGDGLEGMRTLLRGSLKRSLGAMGEEDRLAAAWTVVCGRALSERGSIVGYADGVVQVEVVDAVWLHQMSGMRKQLTGELGSIANVPVREIRFTVRGRDMARTDERVLQTKETRGE